MAPTLYLNIKGIGRSFTVCIYKIMVKGQNTEIKTNGTSYVSKLLKDKSSLAPTMPNKHALVILSSSRGGFLRESGSIQHASGSIIIYSGASE